MSPPKVGFEEAEVRCSGNERVLDSLNIAADVLTSTPIFPD